MNRCKWCRGGFGGMTESDILLNRGVCSSCVDDERARIAELAADYEDDTDDDRDDCWCGKTRDDVEAESGYRCDSCGGVVA